MTQTALRAKHTMKCQPYGTKVAALLFLRGLNSDLDFLLAGWNLAGIGALDGLVFKTRDGHQGAWTSYFIQLKDTDKCISLDTLTHPTGVFGLPKYCKSFEDIKTAMAATERQVMFDGDIKDSHFVIFTSAKPNVTLGEERRVPEQIETFLGSNSGKVFKFDPDGDTDVEKAVADSLKDFADGGRDFLKKLRIFAAQPSEAELDALLRVELRKAVGDEDQDVDEERLCACFVENVATWSVNENHVLRRGSDLFQSARNRASAETVSVLEAKAIKLDLVFEEAALAPLREVLDTDSPVVLVGSSEQTSRLTCTKLLQAFDSLTPLFLGSECFLSKQQAVISEWRMGHHNTLIVSINSKDPATNESACEKVLELCGTPAHPKRLLVVLTSENNGNGFQYFKDTFKFSDLTSSSSDNILMTKFNLQGHPISWNTFFGDSCDYGFDALSASWIVEVMTAGSKLSVGKVLAEPAENPASPFPLHLQPTKSDDSEYRLVDAVTDLSERVVLVSGESDMGMSTLVTQLAMATKEAHPQLWVISIALSDHVRPLAEGKHEDIAGFLLAAAEIDTSLEQWMFKFALQVSGNVVVILKGFEEETPIFYENSCSRLLENLIDTKAKKIWLTTPISVLGKLKRRLSTSGARLCAFSEDPICLLTRPLMSNRDLLRKSCSEGFREEALDDFLIKLFEITFLSVEPGGAGFLAIPLQTTHMMAEVFAHDVISEAKAMTHPETLSLLRFLEFFIEKKIKAYIKNERLSSDTNFKTNHSNARVMFLNSHMEAALTMTVSRSFTTKLQSRKVIDEFPELSPIDKSGFIIGSSSYGQPRFVHTVFADFFAALWFAQHLPEYALAFCGRDYDRNNFACDSSLTRLLCDQILAKNCPLHTAVLNGDVDKVNALLQAGADVNARDITGRTPLHLIAVYGYAVSCGRKVFTFRRNPPETFSIIGSKQGEIFELLILASGIDVNVKDTELINGSPLKYAAMYRHTEMMDRLLAHNADPACLDAATLDFLEGPCIMNRVLQADMVHLLAIFLDTRPDKHYEPRPEPWHLIPSRNGILSTACSLGSCRIIQMLVGRWYDTDGPALLSPIDLLEDLELLLTTAARFGRLEIVKLIVKTANGAYKDFANKIELHGETALHSACASGHSEVAAFLIDNGADVASLDKLGGTCLHRVAVGDKLGLAEMILSCVAQTERLEFINRKDGKGKTALHLTFLGRVKADVAAFLIDNGADVTILNTEGATCLHLAVEKNRPDLIRKMLGTLADADLAAFVNVADELGYTALHRAAQDKCLETVTLLVNAGAKMSYNCWGETPLISAVRSGRLDVVEYLVTVFGEECDADGVKWIDAKDEKGRTVLDWASGLRNHDLVMFLYPKLTCFNK